MTHLDLFSGIGGFALAARNTWGEDHNVIAFCEIEKFCQLVLNKHWPNVPIHEDITTLDATVYENRIDLLTGGFPCQPYSIAGQRKGSEDHRALWPDMLRVIRESRPRWIIGENVVGFVEMELADCVNDLECLGYEVQCFDIPAGAIGARHRRRRIWILANLAEATGGAVGLERSWEEFARLALTSDATPTNQWVTESQWASTSKVGRVVHGIPRQLDRLGALGNAIVPQVAEEIMQCIKAIDELGL